MTKLERFHNRPIFGKIFMDLLQKAGWTITPNTARIIIDIPCNDIVRVYIEEIGQEIPLATASIIELLAGLKPKDKL